MTPEERRFKRRERYHRKKEWQATLKGYVEFAAYIVRRKREEREQRTLDITISPVIDEVDGGRIETQE